MNEPKIILGIETSCDETAAAVMQKGQYGVQILSNIVASSASLQAKYGGVIPEQAAREQLKSIIPVIEEALRLASLAQGKQSLDAIAVTEGPGLIGSLLVGVETAKTLSLTWNKPFIPINHLIGHFYANWITEEHLGGGVPRFPCIGLLVSGGHTDLILMKDHGKYEYLGGTRDDAAGEAFDKTARLLDLPYPGGPMIAKMAEEGDPNKIPLPRPMINSDDLDFSFSGLKTAVANLVQSSDFRVQSKKNESTNYELTAKQTKDLAASVEAAIVDVLVKKTVRAIQLHRVDQIVVAGGVAANRRLREKLTTTIQSEIPHVKISIPPVNLCTDNAAYIATTAFFNYHPTDPLVLQANPNLSLSH